MSKVKYSRFDTVEELKNFEVVSDKVSDKYVPIFTSDIIEILSPEYVLDYGEKFSNSNTQHSVFLYNKQDNSSIVISNSYDRSLAFSLHLISNSVRVPLDLDRQIHIGHNAASLVEGFKADKQEVFEAIEHAKDVIIKLRQTNIPDYVKEEVTSIVFADKIKQKRFIELDLIVSEKYETCYSFINEVTSRYIKGEYNLVVTAANEDGEKIQKGRKLTNRFDKLKITNAVYKYLSKELPELFV